MVEMWESSHIFLYLGYELFLCLRSDRIHGERKKGVLMSEGDQNDMLYPSKDALIENVVTLMRRTKAIVEVQWFYNERGILFVRIHERGRTNGVVLMLWSCEETEQMFCEIPKSNLQLKMLMLWLIREH